MSTVWIDDFLKIEGAEQQSRDADKARFTGYSRLTLLDFDKAFQLDTSTIERSRPGKKPAEAVLDVRGIESEHDDDGEVHIRLRPGGRAQLWFHHANPLTPGSGGIWLDLRIISGPDGCHLKFDENFGKGCDIYFRSEPGNKWLGWNLHEADAALSLTQWLEILPYEFDSNIRPTTYSTDHCVPLGDGRGSLVDARHGHELGETLFYFGAGIGPDDEDRITLFRAVTEIRTPLKRGVSIASSHALGIHDELGLVERELGCDVALAMECASIPDNPGNWCLDWKGLPTQRDGEIDRLSARALWHLVARQHALGLKTLSNKSHLSFFPTDINEQEAGSDNWRLRYSIENKQGAWQTELREMLTTDCDIDLTLAMAEGINGSSLTLSGRAYNCKGPSTATAVEADTLPDSFSIRLGLESGNEPGQILVAGVLLQLGALIEPGEVVLTRRKNRSLGDPPVDTRLTLTFESPGLIAAHEPPEVGYELDSEWLNRDTPLVIDLNEHREPVSVEVRERSNAAASRSIEILVRSIDEAAVDTDVVVIDTSPLRVARVITKLDADAQRDRQIATFHDDPERPTRWDFATDNGELDLILPPQTIGEEMVKGNLSVTKESGEKVPVPLEDELFDFRFSPTTWLRVDRTAVATARAAAPWSLRRILDRRPGEVGLELVSAEFELLYGMTARILERQGLRVAEHSALLGRIPFPNDLLRTFNPDYSDKETKDYARKVANWIRSLLNHASDLPVFRDLGNREQLTIDRGVEFDLRITRQTADPFRLECLHPIPGALDRDSQCRQSDLDLFDDIERDNHRLPLRGGVDYGFESPNIYQAVLEHEKVDFPGRPQGSLAGLRFGALGGSGEQEAVFDEGRTVIITKTTHGRLDSLTIVRIGRIAMLWNHARHVIVYERSTRTAPRYIFDQKPDFEGLAALRKVKEYIEITQAHRAFPDIAGSERRSGPLVGCFFESTMIPVRSQWGNDVKGGFVMPLHGPVPAALRTLYPKPNVFLEMARPPAKGGKVSQVVTSPERLTFFSSSVEGVGSNPDAWPARADVDFPVTRRPRPPKVAFLPAFSGDRHQPDAQSFDYGQQRFTVDVKPAEEAVNLVHGRPLPGIEAKVKNVSLARGKPASAQDHDTIEGKLGVHFGELEAQIGDSLRELANHTAKLAGFNSEVPVTEFDGLRDSGLKLIRLAKQQARDLDGKLKDSAGDLGKAADQWRNLQDQWNADQVEPWKKHVKDELVDTLNSVLDEGVNILGNAPVDAVKNDVKSRMNTALDVARTRTRERIERTAFVPQRAFERLESTIDDQVSQVSSIFTEAEAGWQLLLNDMESRFNTESPGALEEELRSAIHRIDTLVTRFAGDAARQAKDLLGPLFPDLPFETGKKGPVRRLAEGLDRIANTFLTWSSLVESETIPPFELGRPDWNALRHQLVPVSTYRIIEIELEQILVDLREPFEAALKEWQEALNTELEAINQRFEKARDEISRAIDSGADELQRIGQEKLGTLRKEVEEGAKQLKDRLGDDVNNLLDDVRDSLGVDDSWLQQTVKPLEDVQSIMNDQVMQHIDELDQALQASEASIGSIARLAEKFAMESVASLRGIGERVERAAIDNLRDRFEDIEDNALEMVRSLAEGPVTDTLRSTREWVGYYYDEAKDAIDLTRSGALFNELGDSVLNGLSTQVPIDRIRDRLMPQLRDFDLNQLLPDFAGLKLEHLFEGVKIPEDPLAEYDWIDLRHGFDKARLTAWSTVTIDRKFGENLEVFNLDPLRLSVHKPRFKASSRFEVGKSSSLAQQTTGRLAADWVVDMNGQAMLTIEGAALEFNEKGDLDFIFEPSDLKLAPALQFITDAVEQFFSPMDGLSITPVAPGGVRAEFSMPVPDIGTGAFTMTGITIYSHFDLLVAGGFEVGTGLWLSRPNRPFGIAILFLGGGGWFGVDVRYRPPKVFETQVSIGLSAGAMVALNFGVARGSAGILFTIGFDFYRNWHSGGSGDVVVSVGMLIWGEFNILGIASAYLRLTLRIEYRKGAMTGYGRISLRIKICWCFTLSVSSEARQDFSGGNKSQHRSLSASVAPLPSVDKIIDADFANLDW